MVFKQPLTFPATGDLATLPEGPAALPELAGVRQVLVEKSSVDPFRNRNLRRLLELLQITDCVVYGLVTEVAVRHACVGLLQLGYRVHLVTDAIREISEPIARRARNELVRDGARLLESTALLESSWEPWHGTTVR